MGDHYALVSIETRSISDVTRVVEQFLGCGTDRLVLGLFFEIVDDYDNNAYAVEFLEKRGLEDDAPIWRELDPLAFSIDVFIHGPWRSALVAVVAESIADHVSRELDTRTAIHLCGGTVPFVVFDRGRVVRRFRDEYDAYVKHLAWRPSD